MKRSKKTYLVDEKDIETIAYADDDEPEEDLFKGESIVEAVNKVFDFERFKNQQDSAAKKSTAKKIVNKYKNMKRPKKKYLVDEKDIETISYADEPEEDLFKGENIVEAINKVFDFERFKKQQDSAAKKKHC